MKLKILITLFFSFLSCPIYALPPVDYQCASEMREVIKEWGAQENWQTRGDLIYYTPCVTFGDWVLIAKDKKNETIIKANEQTEIQIAFDNKCQRQMKVLQKKAPHFELLNDQDLKKLVENKKKGIIYIWSRQMPLSIKGIAEITKAAKEAHLEIILITDTRSKISSLDKKILSNSLVVDSFELMMRNGSLHYPSVFAFQDGQIKNKVKFGYEKKNGYLQDFKNIFNF